jgi:hypothetical protein
MQLLTASLYKTFKQTAQFFFIFVRCRLLQSCYEDNNPRLARNTYYVLLNTLTVKWRAEQKLQSHKQVTVLKLSRCTISVQLLCWHLLLNSQPFTQTRTHTHTRTLTHARAHTHTDKHTHAHTLTQTNTRTHARTHTHTHTRTHTHSHRQTHARTHTHAHSHTHAHTLTQTNTHIQYSHTTLFGTQDLLQLGALRHLSKRASKRSYHS